jgi:cytidyltransferase-like protein
MSKKAFVSGCFDLLHSGHVAFFEEAAKYGDLYVAIGSDRNVFELKHRPTINSQAERLYMIKSLSFVKEVFVAKGSGILDFVQELKEIKPDYFVVNEDGSTPEKKALCDELGLEYVILKREPHSGLTARSTTALRSTNMIAENLTLAGEWLDQPEVSKLAPGSALTISIHPFGETPSSTRNAAIELWGPRLPADQPEKLAKMLFGYRNLPGTKFVDGANIAIGITFAGLTRADYNGNFWPTCIRNIQDEQVLKFIEDLLYLVPFEPQPGSLPVPRTHAEAQSYCLAAEACWQAILNRDAAAFGNSMQANQERQAEVQDLIAKYEGASFGWKICDLGLLLVSEKPLENARHISIRRASD